MKKYSDLLLQADKLLFKAGRKIELLDKLQWKRSVANRFINQWRKKNPQLPKVRYPEFDLAEEKAVFEQVVHLCAADEPLSLLLKNTALSYLTALQMLENIGKKEFTELSCELYGSPDTRFQPVDVTVRRTAKNLLKAVRKFPTVVKRLPEDYCLMPEYVRDVISAEADRVFGPNKIKVVVDPKLLSKASAGPTRIRIRGSTCFAEHDVRQLTNHELFVHSLTLLNGRKQPLKSLGLNSPRTTCTQEGLAVFSEFIVNAIDVRRLRRISARVHATEMGLSGADFIEVFKFFLDQGQDETESYYSAARIFRGGNVAGGVVFTKDVVYLRGFVEVHRFLLKSLRDEKFLYPHYLFAGRLRTDEIPTYETFFQKKMLKLPHYEPDWIKSRSTLLAFLLSSSVMNSLGLSQIDDL